MYNSNNFRPWGHLDWVLSNLPDNQYFFVGCLGTEDRCVAAYLELSTQNKIFGQSFVEVMDVQSDYSIEAVNCRKNNLNVLLSTGLNKSDVTQIDLLSKEEEIISWINNFKTKSDRLIIDISSLPKRFFFPAIKLLLKHIDIKDLLVTYTVPASYHPGNIAERPSDWRALPLFGPQDFPDPDYKLAVVGVGFLPFGLPELLKSAFLGAEPHLFFPFPATPSTYFKTWDFVRQIEASLTLDINRQLSRINGMDPSDTFDHICFLSEKAAKNALLAPYGPKPMSLGMAIYATLTGSPVYYTQPRVYHPNYSKGISHKNSRPEIYAYCLRLDGKNLYSV